MRLNTHIVKTKQCDLVLNFSDKLSNFDNHKTFSMLDTSIHVASNIISIPYIHFFVSIVYARKHSKHSNVKLFHVVAAMVTVTFKM